jgi:DNA polymerase III alpha subunit
MYTEIESTQRKATMNKVVLTENTVIELGLVIPDGYTPKEYLRKVAVDKFYALRINRIADDNSYASEGLSKEVDLLLAEIEAIPSEEAAKDLIAVSLWTEKHSAEGTVVSMARGSVAGKYLPFALGLSLIDPKMDLMFARFLDPTRESAPDIDLNFNDKARKKTMKFLNKKYGKKRSLLARLFRRK